MKNEEVLKENSGKKFDVVLMNPPYSNEQQFLDMEFVEKVNKISNKQIVVHPAKKWISDTKIGKANAECGHLKDLEILEANDIFGIAVRWKYIGIYSYDNTKKYENVNVLFNNYTEQIKYNNFEDRRKYYSTIEFSPEFKHLINKTEKIYQKLKEKYNTMVNDTDLWIYEENDIKRGKKRYNIVKNDDFGVNTGRKVIIQKYLKDGIYKYCLYKGSFAHEYDKLQEWNGQDPEKLINGQVCWLTNKENIKNNIKYWLECPLCDLWRRYKFSLLPRGHIAAGCSYGEIPAVDFNKSEDEFKEYINSLYKFTKEEINTLKEYNIHNADKL